jgi:hypothetical protein
MITSKYQSSLLDARYRSPLGAFNFDVHRLLIGVDNNSETTNAPNVYSYKTPALTQASTQYLSSLNNSFGELAQCNSIAQRRDGRWFASLTGSNGTRLRAFSPSVTWSINGSIGALATRLRRSDGLLAVSTDFATGQTDIDVAALLDPETGDVLHRSGWTYPVGSSTIASLAAVLSPLDEMFVAVFDPSPNRKIIKVETDFSGHTVIGSGLSSTLSFSPTGLTADKHGSVYMSFRSSATERTIVKYDADGNLAWQKIWPLITGNAESLGDLAWCGGRLYDSGSYGTTPNLDRLSCYDPETGDLIWRKLPHPDYREFTGFVCGPPSDQVLYAAIHTATIDSVTGPRAYRINLDGEVESEVVLSPQGLSGSIFIRDLNIGLR